MLDRAGIAAQLKNVSRDKCAAFAVRAAMRVLPLLAIPKNKPFIKVFSKQNRDVFWFWKTEAEGKTLLSILRAYSCSIEYVLTKNYRVDDAIAIKVAAHAASAYATDSDAADTADAFYAAAYAIDGYWLSLNWFKNYLHPLGCASFAHSPYRNPFMETMQATTNRLAQCHAYR